MRISIHYLYNRRGSAAGVALSSHLSHHHVISYPRMYYLGVLSLCYLKSIGAANPAAMAAKVWTLSDACHFPAVSITNAVNAVISDGAGNYRLPEDNNDIQSALCRIAWMPMNLFIGPSSTIRIDDPSQNNDKLPERMPQRQKDALNQIISALNLYSHSNIPNTSEERGFVGFDNEAAFNQLMDIFFRNINGEITCYDSKISDWLIASTASANSSSSRYQYYPILFYGGARAEALLSNYRNKRQLLSGKFAVKERNNQQIVTGKNFKVLATEAEDVLGIVNNLDEAYRRDADKVIRDFL